VIPQSTPQPSPTSTATAPVAGQGTAVTTVTTPPPATAAEMYEAMRHQRRIIEDQLRDQQSLRSSIANQLRDPAITASDKAGLEARLVNIDARIISLDAALATAEAQEARAAAEPGAIVEAPNDPSDDVIEVVAVVSVIFMFVFVLPMSIAWARRIWRKHAVTVSLTPEMTQRLDSIDRAVEATALEVERIGEGQRFVTTLLASRAEAAKIPIPAPRDSTPS
jgi:hypothetical protein